MDRHPLSSSALWTPVLYKAMKLSCWCIPFTQVHEKQRQVDLKFKAKLVYTEFQDGQSCIVRPCVSIIHDELETEETQDLPLPTVWYELFSLMSSVCPKKNISEELSHFCFLSVPAIIMVQWMDSNESFKSYVPNCTYSKIIQYSEVLILLPVPDMSNTWINFGSKVKRYCIVLS